jgi:rhomboid protease GluP
MTLVPQQSDPRSIDSSNVSAETNQYQYVVRRRTIAPPYVTYAIIAANVAVYLAMGVSGVSWTEPSIPDAIRWGADFGPLTLNGQWWRLFTSTFVHFGILHIAFNMWCLLDLGRSLEFLMGRKAFAATYLASGIAASMVSLWWRPLSVSAGASGAIFGVAGAFASYIFLKRVDLIPQALKRIRNSLAFFIIVNLAWGAARVGIDNSAHLGGLIAGAIVGAIVPPIVARRIRAGDAATVVGYGPSLDSTAQKELRATRTALAIVIGSAIVLIAAAAYVRKDHVAYAEYGQAVTLIKSGRSDEAIAMLEQAVQSDHSALFAQMMLGELHLEQQNPNAAVLPLEQAAALDGKDDQIRQNLALAYLGAGRSLDAAKQIAAVLADEKTEPSWDTGFIDALAAEQGGNYAQAVGELRAVIQAKPDLSEARDDLRRIDGSRGDSLAAQSPLVIPYSKLVVKSNDWPLFP